MTSMIVLLGEWETEARQIGPRRLPDGAKNSKIRADWRGKN